MGGTSGDVHWYRSWPSEVPPGRAHVLDALPRLLMSDQNYTTMQWPRHEPGWFLLEWDIALDSVGRERFATHAMAEPERLRVAPYPIFPFGGAPAIVHRNGGRWLREGEPTAEMFGFGCIYFPQHVLDAFWSAPPPRVTRTGLLTDTVFSDWYRQGHPPAVVDWSVHPQHLHGD